MAKIKQGKVGTMKSYTQTRIEAKDWLQDCDLLGSGYAREIPWNKLVKAIDQNWEGGFLAFIADQEHDSDS